MTPEQRLERIAAWARATPGVQAALVIGSRARTETPADAHSDSDVVLVCDEPSRWLSQDAWLAEFGTPVLTFAEETAVGGQLERRVLYDDGGDVDFSIIHPEAAAALAASAEGAAVLRRGRRSLYDADGRFQSIPLEPLAAGWPPPAASVADAAHDFWYHVLWAARKLVRGELWVALHCLHGHLAPLLRRAVEWDAAAGGAQDVWFRGRFLERWARPEIVARLRGTMADYDPLQARAALLACADLFADLTRPIATAVGAAYPEAGEQRVRELVAELFG